LTINRLRGGAAVAAALALTLATVACTGDDLEPDDPRCRPYADYQGHQGTTVEVYGPFSEAEGQSLQDAWAGFEACTGISVEYRSAVPYDAQLRVRVDAGDLPDLAVPSHPGLIEEMHGTGRLVAAPAPVRELAERYWAGWWLDYATMDGVFYGAPLSAQVKSLVWYSPGDFARDGYDIPQTWEELIALSDQIAATGTTPWCAGIAGDATGWPGTDWIEDMLMRLHGAEVYDQWWRHEIAFNDPRVVEAFEHAGQILRNPDYVNGGFDGPASIAAVRFQEAGLPILDGDCALHRQAASYTAHWPEGAVVAEDGDVFAFYLPAIDQRHGRPVLGSAQFVVAFSDRPEVQAVQTYLATAGFATSRAGLGGWVSANEGVDLAGYPDPVDRLAAEILRDRQALLLFDASELMPGRVGADSFPSQLTEWIVGQDTGTTVDNIEASWPG
jgi:alpha-glucoside transport system substrate-binding protein